MSLRLRIFLLFGTLIAVMVGAEWWLVRGLTRDLQEEVGDVALSVGSSVMGLFGTALPTSDSEIALVYARSGPPEGHELDPPTVFFEEGEQATMEFERSIRLQGGPASELTGIAKKRFVIGSEPRLMQGELLAEDCPDPYAQVPGPEGDFPAGFVVSLALTADEENLFSPMRLTADTWSGSGGMQSEWQTVHSLAPSLGALSATDIEIPREGFDEAMETFLSRLLLGSFAILGLGLLVAGYVAHRVSHPLRGLSTAVRRVEAGALGTQAPETGDREVTEAIAAFNSMSTRLAELDAEARTLREREHLSEMGEMARGLAHAMRNPLNLLGLSVEELASQRDSSADSNLIRSVRDQIQRVDRSLRTFLALSTGEAGERTEVDLEAVARDVALELLQSARGRVRVNVSAEPGLPPLHGVEAELRAVIHVLVVNAVEASPEGAEVRVHVASTGNGVRVQVEDEGPGLAPEVRERLFMPHVSTKEQGAGMGLFLARRIAQNRYAGSLDLRARAEGGTLAQLDLEGRTQHG